MLCLRQTHPCVGENVEIEQRLDAWAYMVVLPYDTAILGGGGRLDFFDTGGSN